MNRKFRTPSLLGRSLLLALLSVSSLPLAAAEDPAKQIYERENMLRNLSHTEAEVLIWEQCPKPATDVCRVRGAGLRDNRMWVVVFADDATHAKIARVLTERDGALTTRSFQVVLLVASKQGTGIPADLPANCKQAVEDISAFLPFKAYRMIDAGLVRTADFGKLLLTGPKNMPVSVELNLGPGRGKELSVRTFAVRSADSATLLNTQFGIEVGETLAVGTSRLEGDEAMVVLVSALE